MNPITVKNKMQKLVDDINRYNDAYYKNANPLISDYQFDKLLKELKDLEDKYPQFKDPNSPTTHVGADTQSGFREVKHSIPMMSLDNTYNSDDVKLFMNSILHTCYAENIDYIVEFKIDGLSISCRYKDGVLVQALTRGNGLTGDDVTTNVLNIPDVPQRIEFPGKTPEIFEIRGEIFMTRQDFDKVNAQRAERNLPLLANPRNAAAGTLKSLDPRVVRERPLKAVFYALGEVSKEINIPTQEAMFKLFEQCNIPYIPYYYKAHLYEEVLEAVAEIDVKRHELDIPTDGAVIKVNRFDQRLLLGNTAKCPRWAKAYKFAPNQIDTEVLGITIQVGRTGVLTPVAELKPVQLDGSVVKRATLHNEDFIKKMDIRIGDTVTIEKAGEIIPAVVCSIMHQVDSTPFNFYEHLGGKCPVCGENIKREDGEAAWRCTNPHCKAKLEQNLAHFAEKDALDIEGLGGTVAKAIVATGKVNSIVDLFELNSIDFVGLIVEGGHMLGVNGIKIYNALKEAKNKPLGNWLFALGIPGVGKTVASKLGHKYKDLHSFWVDFRVVDNSVVENNIKTFLDSKMGNDIITGLLDLGINPQGTTVSSNQLTGKKIVITGALKSMDRHAAEETVRNAGGEVIGAVSKQTDYVVLGESNKVSTKAKKAKELGIPVLSEQEFLTMIR